MQVRPRTSPSARRARRLLAAASAAAACAGPAQALELAFRCRVAEGPAFAACEALANELPRDKVDILRRRLETTPACQLAGERPGSEVTRKVYYHGALAELDESWLSTPRETAPDWTRTPSVELLARLYPEAAARDSVEGRAVIDCVVGVDGSAKACRLRAEEPAGYGFGEAALALADAFRFRPAMRDCQPVEDRVVVPIRFSLPETEPLPWRPSVTPAGAANLVGFLVGLGLIVAGGAAAWRRRARPAAPGAPSIVEAGRPPPLWALAVAGAALSIWCGMGLFRSGLAAAREIAARGIDPATPVAMLFVGWLLMAIPALGLWGLMLTRGPGAADGEERPRSRGGRWRLLQGPWNMSLRETHDPAMRWLIIFARFVAAIGVALALAGWALAVWLF